MGNNDATGLLGNLPPEESGNKLNKVLNSLPTAEPTPPSEPPVYAPSLDDEPPNYEPVISMGGVTLCTVGGLFTVIGGAGLGKSHLITEGIVSKALNPESERLLFDVNLPTGREGVVYLDTERTQRATWEAFRRCLRRAGIMRQCDVPPSLRFLLLSLSNSNEERRAIAERAIDEVNAGIVIVDGIGDFVTDPNDSEESAKAVTWFLSLAKVRGFGITTSLHSNPMNLDKGRGHLGSDLWRRSDCYGSIITNATTDTRTFTTRRQLGKVRHGRFVEGSFRWDEQTNTLRECETEPTAMKTATFEKLQELAREVYGERLALTHSELWRAIAERTGTKEDNAKKKLNQMRTAGLLEQSERGAPWFLCDPSPDDPEG